MDLLDMYREFTKHILTDYDVNDKIKQEAKDILDKDFKETVIDLWYYDFINSYSAKENRKNILSTSKIGFIAKYQYSTDKSKFIEENWDHVDKIISILQEYVKSLSESPEDN